MQPLLRSVQGDVSLFGILSVYVNLEIYTYGTSIALRLDVNTLSPLYLKVAAKVSALLKGAADAVHSASSALE